LSELLEDVGLLLQNGSVGLNELVYIVADHLNVEKLAPEAVLGEEVLSEAR